LIGRFIDNPDAALETVMGTAGP